MKTKILKPIIALTLVTMVGVAEAATITVNTADNTDFGAGKTNLVRAIQLLQDGDTINFNIPGGGVHYILTPTNGYPLITNQNVTFDGYSQPGAVPNSAPIHAANNAQLKIVLSSTNGNGIAIRLAAEALVGRVFERPGFNNNDNAILAFFRGTNNWIKGFAFQSAVEGVYQDVAGPIYGIAFMADDPSTQPWPNANAGHWRVSGCWSGLDPVTGQPVYMPDGTLAAPRYAIGMQRHRNSGPTVTNVNYAQPGTVGVAAGSSNPRAEFNVFLGVTAANLTGANYRICGNFFNVLPDGMHNFDVAYLPNAFDLMSADSGVIIIARQGDNMLIGTDGDGVNDDQEGNVFGGVSAYPFNNPAAVNNYHYFDAFYNPAPSNPTQATNNVFAGNYFGVAVDGVTRFTNACTLFYSFPSTATVRFGSDFDGVSDALEANLLCNNYPFSTHFLTPGSGSDKTPETVFGGQGPECFGGMNPGVRMSFRGNVTLGNDLLPFKYADGAGGRLVNFTNYAAPFLDVNSVNGIIPTLDPGSTFGNLKGTFAPGINGYTNVIIDVYQLDQEGWANGQLFLEPELTDNATYTNGFAQGSKYVGSKVVPNTGNFDISLAGMDSGGGAVTVTVNYSADPPGTRNGRVHTSNFSAPVNLAFIPPSAESVGLTRLVPDTIVWSHSQSYPGGGVTKIGGYVAGEQAVEGTSVEAGARVLGDSTFLLAAITRAANDDVNMSFTSVLIPAAGGTPKLDNLFYTDAGTKWLKQINLSRQTGNPGRVGADPRYGAVNYGGAGEVSLFAFPEFNSDGRWSNPFFDFLATLNGRSFAAQFHQLNPLTLASTPTSKALDTMYGRVWTNSTQANVGQQDVGRTGSSPMGLDNGNFVTVGEDRSGLNNPGGPNSGRAAVATIFAPNGSIVKEAWMLPNTNYLGAQGGGSMWEHVGAFRGGFYARPEGGIIYIYNNAGDLQGTVDVNNTAGVNFDMGRSDGTRDCSDIRSHYVFMAGKSPEANPGHTNIMLCAWDANTRQFITKTIVSDEGNQDVTSLTPGAIPPAGTRLLDRCNIACDAYNRVTVSYRLRPDRTAFTQDQVVARVYSFDGTKFTPLTPTFFPFVQHDSDPNNLKGFKSVEPSVAMTPREILFYAKGIWNANTTPTLDNTHCYTILRHPAPIAAPKPTVTITKSGDNLNLSWNPDDGLFTVQTRSSVTSGSWANATAGNVSPPVSIPAGAGPIFVRLAR